MSRYKQDAESLSDNIINFDLKDVLTLPRIPFTVKQKVFRELHQNPFHFELQK